MNTSISDRPTQPSLTKAILGLVLGFLAGLAVSTLLLKSWRGDPVLESLRSGLSFVGTFAGMYWMLEYWRWKELQNKEEYRRVSVRAHVLSTLISGVLVAVLYYLFLVVL